MYKTLGVLLIVVAVSHQAAWAQPVEWPTSAGGNGHWYELVAAPNIDWESALQQAHVWNAGIGAWGFLATIDSAAENTWVLENVATTQDLWIGLFQVLAQPPAPPCGNEPDLGWLWHSNSTLLTYTNWCSGEPNDNGNVECFLVPHENVGMFASGGCWTDEFPNYPVNGYLVEYDPTLVVPVEEIPWTRVKVLFR